MITLILKIFQRGKLIRIETDALDIIIGAYLLQ